MLIDESRLLLKDGSTISPIYEVESSKDETKEITLPVGKYFVVAFITSEVIDVISGINILPECTNLKVDITLKP